MTSALQTEEDASAFDLSLGTGLDAQADDDYIDYSDDETDQPFTKPHQEAHPVQGEARSFVDEAHPDTSLNPDANTVSAATDQHGDTNEHHEDASVSWKEAEDNEAASATGAHQSLDPAAMQDPAQDVVEHPKTLEGRQNDQVETTNAADDFKVAQDVDHTADDDFHEIDYEDETRDESRPAEIEQSHASGEAVNFQTGSNSPGAAEYEDENAHDGEGDPSTAAANPATEQAAADTYVQNDPPQLNPELDGTLNEASPAASLGTAEELSGNFPEILVSWHGVDYPLFYDSPGSEGRQCFFDDSNLLQCAMEEVLASFRRELADDLADSDELVLQINEMGLEFAEVSNIFDILLDQQKLTTFKSSHPDQFLDITLGSILQVFNDLVKNKDPEASRPLFAFLITRPDCNKRWQALIEDAYQGRNIDEVCIYFSGNSLIARDAYGEEDNEHSDMVVDNGSYPPNDRSGQQSNEDGDDENDLRLVDEEDFNNEPNDMGLDDEYPPQQEQAEEGDFMGTGDRSAESLTLADPVDELEAAITDLDDSTAGAMLQDGDLIDLDAQNGNAIGMLGDPVDDNGGQKSEMDQLDGKCADFLPCPCYKPGFCFCQVCLDIMEEDGEGEEVETEAEVEGVDYEGVQVGEQDQAQSYSCSGPLPKSVYPFRPRTQSDTSMTQFTTSTDTQFQGHNDGNSDLPLLNPADGEDAFSGEFQPAFDDAARTTEYAVSEIGAMADTNKVNPNATAAATLENNDEEDDFNADFDLDADISVEDANEGPVPTTEAEESKVFDEIDWREGPDQGEANANSDNDSTTVSAKRPRSNEVGLLDAAEEPDLPEAKRRRSEA